MTDAGLVASDRGWRGQAVTGAEAHREAHRLRGSAIPLALWICELVRPYAKMASTLGLLSAAEALLSHSVSQPVVWVLPVVLEAVRGGIYGTTAAQQ